MKIPLKYEHAIEDTIRYLESEEALQTIKTDPYWPKWHFPWLWKTELRFHF